MTSFNNAKKAEIRDRKLYTGVVPVKIALVCPSETELREYLGTENVTVQPYRGANQSGQPQYRLDFWIEPTSDAVIATPFGTEPVEFKTKFSLWVSDRIETSKSGSIRIINNFGQSTWAESVTAAVNRLDKNGNRWFAEEGAREAREGEVQLFELLASYLNVDLNSKTNPEGVGFNEFADIAEGDFRFIEEIITSNPDASVKVLIGVKDGKYQSVFTKVFMSSAIRSTKRIEKEAIGQYGFNDDWGGSTVLQLYNPNPPAAIVNHTTESSQQTSKPVVNSLFS